MYGLTDGQKGLQDAHLQMQLNFPSSAASPPFTSTNPATHHGDLGEPTLPLASTTRPLPANKVTFARALHNPAESTTDQFSFFSPHKPASPAAPAVCNGPRQALQTSDEPSSGELGGKHNKPEKAEKNQKPRKEPKKVANAVAGKRQTTNGKLSHVSKRSDSVTKNGKNSRKPMSPNGWSGTAQNGGVKTDMKGELTLRSVLNDYWKMHKSETVNDFDIEVFAGMPTEHR
jgi:hypothetical protein